MAFSNAQKREYKKNFRGRIQYQEFGYRAESLGLTREQLIEKNIIEMSINRRAREKEKIIKLLKVLKKVKINKTDLQIGRTCFSCNQVKELKSFKHDRNARLGRGYECQTCCSKRLRVRIKSDPKRFKIYKFRTSAQTARSKSRRLGYKDEVSKEFLMSVHAKFDNKCFNCGGNNRLVVDHHRPISEGHLLDESNAVLLCFSCNSSKSNRSPIEFYDEEQLDKLMVEHGIY